MPPRKKRGPKPARRLAKFTKKKSRRLLDRLKARVGSDNFDVARARFSKDWLLVAADALDRRTSEIKRKESVRLKRARDKYRDELAEEGHTREEIEELLPRLVSPKRRFKKRPLVAYINILQGPLKGRVRRVEEGKKDRIVSKIQGKRGRAYEARKRATEQLAGALDISMADSDAILKATRAKIKASFDKLKASAKWKKMSPRDRKRISVKRQYRAAEVLLRLLAQGGS